MTKRPRSGKEWGRRRERLRTPRHRIGQGGDIVAKYCRFGGTGGGLKLAGIALMAAGALMFLIFVPRWVWTSALGVVFISVGFLLWRFSA